MELLSLVWWKLPKSMLVIDGVVAILAIVYPTVAWIAWWRRSQTGRCQSERALAASTLGQVLSLNLTAASVLATGVGWKLADPSLNEALFAQLSMAAIWLLGAVVFGGLGAIYMIAFLHKETSLAESHFVVGPAVTQFCFTTAGALFMILAVFLAPVGRTQPPSLPTLATATPTATSIHTPTALPKAPPTPMP